MDARQREIEVTESEYAEYAERGRRVTALMMRDNPDARAKMESVRGKKETMRRYPEAYPKFWEN